MKKISYLCAIAAGLLITVSCTQKPGEATEKKTGTRSLQSLATSVRVPLASAQNNIERYDAVFRGVFGRDTDYVPIRAYTIHAADLLEALGLPISFMDSCRYHHARVYLGLDSLKNFKLYFTPVIDADLDPGSMRPGTDVILSDPSAFPGHGDYVLDLNAPCPKTCDERSPLYSPN